MVKTETVGTYLILARTKKQLEKFILNPMEYIFLREVMMMKYSSSEKQFQTIMCA
jgi:hypothetical protein